MYSCGRLCVHHSVPFKLFLSHHYLPNKFTESVIVPLVKAKSGNINDRNNYRAIALSNTVSKILESIILQHVNRNSDSDTYQFGFKAGHSTGLCTQLLKKTVSYYTDNGSHLSIFLKHSTR